MKLLLDTHIFLWLIQEDRRLNNDFFAAINGIENQLFLSVASVWECVIKYQLGKLHFPESPEIYIKEKRKEYIINILIIDEGSINHLINLPLLHKDPFDRLLISQSLQHNLVIMTKDRAILQYPNVSFFNSNREAE